MRQSGGVRSIGEKIMHIQAENFTLPGLRSNNYGNQPSDKRKNYYKAEGSLCTSPVKTDNRKKHPLMVE